MSAAEKLKMELEKVRAEFKTSESDCGSARVQGKLTVDLIIKSGDVLGEYLDNTVEYLDNPEWHRRVFFNKKLVFN